MFDKKSGVLAQYCYIAIGPSILEQISEVKNQKTVILHLIFILFHAIKNMRLVLCQYRPSLSINQYVQIDKLMKYIKNNYKEIK